MDMRPELSAFARFTDSANLVRQLAAGLVVQRARIEKHRASDSKTARETYQALDNLRGLLAGELMQLACALSELEAHGLARTAEQLAEGLRRFDLLRANYKPIYEALCAFADRLPTAKTVDAATVGRLMNNVRMGYYPTDPENITLLLRGIRFPEGVTTNLLDPCCGCGKALRQLAEGNNCFTYGVELDAQRAEEAQTRLHHVGSGSFFHSRISREAFHVLLLNPPYLSVLNEQGGRTRHEKRFLIDSLPYLMNGGLLIYIVPYYRLTADVCRVLADNYDDLSVWRFTDREFSRFRQVAVLGIRKPRSTEFTDTRSLERFAIHPEELPTLNELQAERYVLPAVSKTVELFRGERFNEKELAEQLCHSDSFARLMQRKTLDETQRPLLPLSIGQIGLIGGSGMINGLIECESPHIIKGRIVKEKREEREERFDAKGRHQATDVREVITNKMIFNVLTPNGFKALT